MIWTQLSTYLSDIVKYAEFRTNFVSTQIMISTTYIFNEFIGY